MDIKSIKSPLDLSGKLVCSLSMIASAAPAHCDDWVVIGSAAARLMGAEIDPADVDVTAPHDTIREFLESLGVSEDDRTPHPRFRSTIFKSLDVDNGLPVDFMGDMILLNETSRTPVRIRTRIAVSGSFGTVWIPGLDEQLGLLRRFGREKDLARIPVLQSLKSSS